jgi:hypothetical protein
LHREDGPAAIERDPATGLIRRSTWHLDGQRVSGGREYRVLRRDCRPHVTISTGPSG